jgi:hypothetical protein
MTTELQLWSAKTSITVARKSIQDLIKSDDTDSVTKESLEIEVRALSHVLLRIEQLEGWLKLVDSQRNIS